MHATLMTVRQVSERLNVSPATVYALVSEGRISAHRFGLRRGTIRISEDSLQQYEEAAKVAPKTVLSVNDARPNA